MIADYLLHFTSFTDWPELNNNAVNLCVLGADPFHGYLENKITQTPKNRAGLDIILSYMSLHQPLTNCNIVYIDKARDLTSKLKGNSTLLTVGNGDDFISRGGIVNFYIEDKKIRVEVNITALRLAQLSMSSHLLKHARITTYQQKKNNHG